VPQCAAQLTTFQAQYCNVSDTYPAK
jgi:hypothetical protein